MDHLIIKPNYHVLTDACVVSAIFNKLDTNHQKCFEFQNNIKAQGKRLLFPGHGLFEIMRSWHRRLNSDTEDYEGFEKNKMNIEYDVIDVNQELANKAEMAELFDLFPTLKAGDLIYACIAKIYNVPFATADKKDFKAYESAIEIIDLSS